MNLPRSVTQRTQRGWSRFAGRGRTHFPFTLRPDFAFWTLKSVRAASESWYLTFVPTLAATLGPDRAARRRTVDEALARVELAGFAQRDPATLSGGERARVALLRVLLSEPRALLLDEPFSKLDLTLRDRFRSLVFQSATHLPVLLVSHDPQDSVAAGGDVLELRPNHGHRGNC